ncbi:MAG: rhomboid family intramembrane serine protease [Chitinophagaceae bacterium]|jgi:membrane associated rhomboid family serine protease|nr:rhomboid family intramembrane serine protease [Chitinophagaceae bacterium]
MPSDIRPGGFQVLPTIIKNLIIINALVWLAQITIGDGIFPVEETFALHYYKSVFYKPWQLLTYMFLHSPGNFFHILFNMFALWMFGSTLENLWGPKRFLIFYLLCGLGAAMVHMLAMGYDMSKLEPLFEQGSISPETFYGTMNIPTLGASGAVMGIFAAFAYTFPNSQLFILPIPFPIKAKWALLGLVALDLFGGVSNQQSGVAHFAHIGGAIVGIVLVMLWNKKNRNTFY